MADQNMPDHQGRGCEEVVAVLECDSLLVNELQIHLVHQGRAPQRMARRSRRNWRAASLGVTATDPALLNITGNFTQSAAGSLNIKIAGLVAGSQFDQVAINGAAMLNGTLNVTLVGGFTPAAGNSFAIMTFGLPSGVFATTNLPPLQGGLSWNMQYGSNSLTLTVQ